MEYIDHNLVKSAIKKHPDDANKITVGSLFSICGSYGMAGASIMSAKSALRSGVGLLHLIVPDNIYPIMASTVVEAVYHPYNNVQEVLQDYYFIYKDSTHPRALLMGCGLSVNSSTVELVNTVVSKCKVPMILDADALNIIAKDPSILNSAHNTVIVTPHDVEMSRLLGCNLGEVLQDRAKACLDFSAKYNVITVLKGKETLVANPQGEIMCNNLVGNNGMAVGGSGDVLAGIIASLVAQGNNPYKSACASVYIHGFAGDIAKEKYGAMSMLPTDIIECLPQAFKNLKF